MNEILLLIIGGCFGGVLGWFLLRQRGKTTDLRNQHQSAIEIVELTSQLSTANSQLENVTKEFDDAKIISSTVQANFNKLETEKAVIDSQVERLPDLAIELNDLRSRLITEQKRSTEFQTRLEEQTRSGEEKLKLLKEAKEALTTEFQNLGQKIFEEKTEKFTHQNKTNLESLLNPFRDQMSAFKQKVDDVYDKEAKDRSVKRAS